MKQKLLNSIRLRAMMLVAVMCAAFAGQAWATDTTGTLTLSSSNKFGTTSGSTKDDDKGNTWTCVGSNIQNSYQTTYSGQQFGTSSTNNTFTFTANFSGKTVTGVSITAAAGNSTPTYDISVGGSSKKSGSLSTTSKTYSTGAISSTGNIVITLKQNGGKKAVYLGSIVVTYTTGGSSAVETTTTIDASGITNDNVLAGTAAGSLSASVTYGDPAAAVPAASVTWSGNNDAVATINASTGAVTLVGAGNVTFTATYGGVDDEYLGSYDTHVMTVISEDPSLKTIWSENFSGYAADAVPSGGTYSYACVDGGSATKIYAANIAGGVSPELLVGKNNGSFTATIPLLAPTYAYSGDLTLKYKTNANDLNVKTTTDGLTVYGEANPGEGITYNTSGEHTITFKGVTASTENITIVFTATASDKNVRLDDIVLKGVQEELSIVATPSISPASGSVVSGTEVTITCLTEGATIHYTTDGTTPSSGSTAYNPASKPTITANTTIKAIGIKAGLANSTVASATYTIATPCDTPTFSVAAGEVDKGTTVELSCATDGATIYYTTDGTTPTASSTEYTSAITINTAQTIKAIAIKDGNANSEVASASYTVRDYVSLPFNWAGGTSSELTALTGVTASGLGSDYAPANAPYRVKMDGKDDYIQIKTNAQPIKVLVGVKMLGGATTSKIKVQESADGSSFTDVEELTISGASNAVLNLKTSNSFASSTRYVKIIKSVHGSNIGVGPIVITDFDGLSVTLNASGYATFASTYALDFSDASGYSAWQVTDANTSTGVLTFSQITGTVKAGTGVLLNGTASASINIPVAASGSDISATNLLEGITTATAVSADEYYGLSGNTFKKVNAGTVPAGKALLPADEVAGVKAFTFVFEDETTGISTVAKGQEPMANGQIFNLAGQKMSKLQKGVNIVNGKKVLVK